MSLSVPQVVLDTIRRNAVAATLIPTKSDRDASPANAQEVVNTLVKAYSALASLCVYQGSGVSWSEFRLLA